MTDNPLLIKCKEYLKTLCIDITERCVGSNGNRQATHFFEKELSLSDWETELIEFEAIDWKENGVSASTIEELSKIDAKNKIIFFSEKLPESN